MNTLIPYEPEYFLCKIINLLDDIRDVFRVIIADKYMYSLISNSIHKYHKMMVTFWSDHISVYFCAQYRCRVCRTICIGGLFNAAHNKIIIRKYYSMCELSDLIIIPSKIMYDIINNILSGKYRTSIEHKTIIIYNGIDFFRKN